MWPPDWGWGAWYPCLLPPVFIHSKSRQGVRGWTNLLWKEVLLSLWQICVFSRAKHLDGEQVLPSIRLLAWYKHRKSHSFMRKKREGKHPHIWVLGPFVFLAFWKMYVQLHLFIANKKESFVVALLLFCWNRKKKSIKIVKKEKESPKEVDELHKWVSLDLENFN